MYSENGNEQLTAESVAEQLKAVIRKFYDLSAARIRILKEMEYSDANKNILNNALQMINQELVRLQTEDNKLTNLLDQICNDVSSALDWKRYAHSVLTSSPLRPEKVLGDFLRTDDVYNEYLAKAHSNF